MPAYHIAGPSGSGKSHVGRELGSRGYRVIETDFEKGLSSWVNKDTGAKVAELPPQPVSEEWLNAHSWLWDELRLSEILDEIDDKPVFLVGGAHNEKEFFDLFDKRFGLFVDTPTLVTRLRLREPERWIDGSAELNNVMEWNEKSKEHNLRSGAALVNSSVPVQIVADIILSHIN